MKTIFLAAAAALSLGIGSAYAGEGEGHHRQHPVHPLPGVVAQAPAQKAPAVATAQNGQVMKVYSPSRAAAPGCSRPTRTATASARPVVMRRGRHLCRPFAHGEALSHLDQLERLAARALDHHGARVAEPIRLLEEHHALAAQLGHPRVEIGDAQRDVVLQLPARAGQRRFALVRVPAQRHVAELDARRAACGTFLRG